MKFLKEIVVLLVLCFVGEIISYFLPFPMPGSMIGFLLLLIVLLTGVLGKNPLEITGNFFLSNLQLFLIPAAVSLITVLSMVGGAIGRILIICVVTTIITFVVTAYTVKAVMWMQKRAKRGKA